MPVGGTGARARDGRDRAGPAGAVGQCHDSGWPAGRSAARTARAGASARRGGAVERRHGATSFWTGVSDGALVISKTYDDLWSIGSRAVAATRRPVPADEVTVSVDPEAVLAATGSTWDQVAAEIRKLAQD